MGNEGIHEIWNRIDCLWAKIWKQIFRKQIKIDGYWTTKFGQSVINLDCPYNKSQ
jgi:hypothetical protein